MTDLVTSAEAADILGVRNRSTVNRYVAEGKLVPVRKLPGLTGAFLFDRAAVLSFKEERAARRPPKPWSQRRSP